MHRLRALLWFALLCAPVGACAETPAAPSGAALARPCMVCHGVNGVSVGPAAPSIAGQPADYLRARLTRFRRDEAVSTIMGRIAKGYDDEESGRLADYFSALPYSGHAQSADPRQAARGAQLHKNYCEQCHAQGGRIAAPGGAILAGQWRPYLRNRLADLAVDANDPIPQAMRDALAALRAAEGASGIDALLHFYGAQAVNEGTQEEREDE